MSNIENEMREQISKQFKAWFADYEKSREANGWMPLEPFVVTHMHNAFIASRQALAVELPSIQCIRTNDYTAEETREACRRAIESQGVKCK